jgi:hypothetical protein
MPTSSIGCHIVRSGTELALASIHPPNCADRRVGAGSVPPSSLETQTECAVRSLLKLENIVAHMS